MNCYKVERLTPEQETELTERSSIAQRRRRLADEEYQLDRRFGGNHKSRLVQTRLTPEQETELTERASIAQRRRRLADEEYQLDRRFGESQKDPHRDLYHKDLYL